MDETRKQKEQKIKEAFLAAMRRKRVNREIDSLLKQCRGKRIIDLLPMIKHRYPHLLAVAIERAERSHYEPGSKNAVFLANFKVSLEKSE